MSQLRKDPVVERWVIIAEERKDRPYASIALEPVVIEADPACPFCEGSESMTPPEVFAIRENDDEPNSTGWSLRIVPNKYPALNCEEEVFLESGDIFHRSVNGVGFHEVIIETPDHFETLSKMSDQKITEILISVKKRFLQFKKDKRIVCAQFFKNHGAASGSTLAHAHSQIIALPIISRFLSEELKSSEAIYKKSEKCAYCDIVGEQNKSSERFVNENKEFVSFTPFAPRFEFETWIAPKSHCDRFELMSDDNLLNFASLLGDLLKRIDIALGAPPYNLILHSAPFDTGTLPWYHWRLEVTPITSRPAGFEWGSGFTINSTSPEKAAKILRESK